MRHRGRRLGVSRSVLSIPGELKKNYTEVVGVAEKVARIFSRTHTYHVHRRQKTLNQNAQSSDSWVTVHNLKQLDGGILDRDDRLHDVADDREQIIAIYDEQRSDHHGGDGTSASSDSENPSPDIFKDAQGEDKGMEHKFAPFTRNDIEITGDELSSTPPPLHVRRGSEPALNRLSPIPTNPSADPTKRWSAAPIIDDQPPSSTPRKNNIDGNTSYDDDSIFIQYPGERGEGSGEEKTPTSSSSSSSQGSSAFTMFSRDSNRCSVQVLSDHPNMVRWGDAAERILTANEGRREPLGGSATSPTHSRDPSHDDNAHRRSILVVLSNDRGPLGIHVIPSTDKSGHDQGLLVEGIESGGRIARDGRIEVHDKIVEINGKQLQNTTFQRAQEIFKNAMEAPELRLRVVKQYADYKNNNELVEGEERLVGVKVANVTSTKKVPHGPSLSSRTQMVMLQSNTRKLGRRITIDLKKGPHGLGFSITTRDNPAGGEAPIYIKNILPKGAAIEDGQLKIGDRLLEVNNVEITGKGQTEVANILRQIPEGGTATLTVSRQEKLLENNNGQAHNQEEQGSTSPKLPRQLVPCDNRGFLSSLSQPNEKGAEDSLMFPWKQREILTFDIPVHDSERAGLGKENKYPGSCSDKLGVSVKGKTSNGPNGSVDLGIFVKNVIHGGAASRDGRLLQNDQLVNINGLSLLGKPNSEAMKTLRTAMHQEGPRPGMITLTVARRVGDLSRHNFSVNDEAHHHSGRDSANSVLSVSSGNETLGGAKSMSTTPTPDHSGASDNSDNTVILNLMRPDSGNRVEDKDLGTLDGIGIRNPVIQRITGNNIALRNESYYKATHDTWNTSQLQHLVMRTEPDSAFVTADCLGSPTVNLPSRDTVIIHDEYDTRNMRINKNINSGPRTSTGGFSDNPGIPEDPYQSQTSLEESGQGFSRDQFGRQSMSEKRHATLDAKNTDTYQRSKKAREEREKQKQMMLAQEKMLAANHKFSPMVDAERNQDLLGPELGGRLVRASSDESLASHTQQRPNHASQPPKHDHARQAPSARPEVGPGLGMKKSSSLESLQTMVQEMALEEEGHRVASGRVPRGRGCNESFRAAVDRSYDAPLQNLRNKMETLAEEESESSGSGFGRGNSRQSSVNSTVDDKYKKVGKKKPGILKGLGSMFRFGKHRKGLENPNEPSAVKPQDLEVDKAGVERLAAARRAQQEEHDRMQEQYRRLLENSKRIQQSGSGQEQSQQQQHSSSMPQSREDEEMPTRSERMHLLRAQHQKRHAERNGTYPTDEVEERYEIAIRQGVRSSLTPVSSPKPPQRHRRYHSQDMVIERLDPVPSEPKPPEPRHTRSHSYDLYGEMGRPGSRSAYVDPHKYSHYVNYEQIQQHLRKSKEQDKLKKLASQQYQDFRDKQTSREQREYQSQRAPREARERPVSNYYEYESVQALINHAQDSTSLPRRPPHSKGGGGSSNNNSTMGGVGKAPMYPGSGHPHHMTMYKQGSGSSVHSIQSNHNVPSQPSHHGPPPPPPGPPRPHPHDQYHHEAMYAAGYRPASHFTKPQPPVLKTSVQVPGSKV